MLCRIITSIYVLCVIMVRQFLQINQQRIKFLTLVFAGIPSIFLIVALLVAWTEVYRPLSETLAAGLTFTLGAFGITILSLFIGGVLDFNKRRKILAQVNWSSFFEKFAFGDTVMDNGRFEFKQEAKQGQIGNFNTIAFVNLRDKAIQFVFLGKDDKNGKAKYDHQCNCHLQFTNLQMETGEIEETVMNFINEIHGAGITPSEWTTHNMALEK